MQADVSVDALVIGGGVIGLATAAALSRKGVETFVLEAGPIIGSGISSRNSEVIHSGIYYPTGSLKHHCCVEGRRALYAYCKERGIPHNRCGKIVVATHDGEETGLARIEAQARSNGVEGIESLDSKQVHVLEPEVKASAGLLFSETGIIDSHAFMLALEGEVEDNGGAVLCGHTVTGGTMQSRSFLVEANAAGSALTISTNRLILAAGPWCHAIAARLEGFPTDKLPPLYLVKGSYFCYGKRSPFRHLIYPMPSDGGLGVHLTLDLSGRARFGPDTQWLDSDKVEDVDFAVDVGRQEAFANSIRNYWPGVDETALQADYSGVRPKLSARGEAAADFCILSPDDHQIDGLVALIGIESPGLTSALPIAELAARAIR